MMRKKNRTRTLTVPSSSLNLRKTVEVSCVFGVLAAVESGRGCAHVVVDLDVV